MKAKNECSFCHGKADLNDTANSDFQINVDISDPNYPVINVSYMDDSDYDNTQVINFCPICGRKLQEETK